MRIGIIAGNFDVIHPGYIIAFKEASEICDEVIVALHTDPTIERPEKIKPILSVNERKEILESIKYIHKIYCYDTEEELHSLIKELKPDVRLLGDDYQNRKDYTAYGLCPEVHFFSRDHGWSTTKFKNLIKEQK